MASRDSSTALGSLRCQLTRTSILPFSWLATSALFCTAVSLSRAPFAEPQVIVPRNTRTIESAASVVSQIISRVSAGRPEAAKLQNQHRERRLLQLRQHPRVLNWWLMWLGLRVLTPVPVVLHPIRRSSRLSSSRLPKTIGTPGTQRSSLSLLANVIGSVSAPRATSTRRRRRRKRKFPPSVDADSATKALKPPASEDIDSSQDGSMCSFKKSHREVWEDKLSWEEIRATKLKPWRPWVEQTLPEPSASPVLLAMQVSERSVTPTPEICRSPILFGTQASEMSAVLTPEARGNPVPSDVSSDGSVVREHVIK